MEKEFMDVTTDECAGCVGSAIELESEADYITAFLRRNEVI